MGPFHTPVYSKPPSICSFGPFTSYIIPFDLVYCLVGTYPLAILEKSLPICMNREFHSVLYYFNHRKHWKDPMSSSRRLNTLG